MKVFLSLVFTFILVFSISAVGFETDLSQNIITTWNDEKGLPSNSILDVIQDKSGYIWLGSYDGLIRFDGKSFTVMKEEDGYSGQAVRVLCLDEEENLWIGSNSNGVYKYSENQFVRYGIENGLPDLSIRYLCFDEQGTLWAGTSKGIAKLKEGESSFGVSKASEEFGIINFVLPCSDGRIFIGSNYVGLHCLKDGKSVEVIKELQKDTYSSGAFFNDMLWFGTSTGKIICVKDDKVIRKIEHEDLNGASINSFYIDGKTIWAATDRGLVCITQDLVQKYADTDGVPLDVISSVFRDKEKNLWIGTEHDGIIKYSPGKFSNYSTKNGVLGDGINSVVVDNSDNLWIASDDGVTCFKSNKNSIERQKQIDSLVENLKSVRVRQIRVDPDGSILFSTYSKNGLLVFYPDGKIETITTALGLPIDRVRFSYRAPSGELWIGTTAGPAVMVGKRLSALTSESKLPNMFILCAMQAADGSVWMGTDGGGAARLDVSGFGSSKNSVDKIMVTDVFTSEQGLAGNVVFRIFEDASANLWFCTAGGLSLFYDGKFYNANTALGLESDSVYEILEDKDGVMWILTSKKVICISGDILAKAAANSSIVSGKIIYDKLDGLAGQLSANAWGFISEDSVVYLPTQQGVSVYNPQTIVSNIVPPPVIIEKISVDDKRIDIANGQVNIPAKAKRLTIDFTALSFTVPERVRFQYMLSGYDSAWSVVDSQREIAYTNLAPGEYTFKVRASNNDGVLNEIGDSLVIFKEAYFYQTIWFYIILVVLLIILVIVIVQIRVVSLKKRTVELDRLVAERTLALEAEKEKSEGLLKNILPSSVLEELMNTGTFTPHVYSDATVLFADIVGFTDWSKTCQPATVITELNNFFTGFDDIMDNWECERIKTLGDGYLACCGFRDNTDHAYRIVNAAIEMLNYTKKFESSKPGGIKIRIGIHTGAIVGGIVGVKKYIFDVFGDVVNTAFRLEALSAPMACTVSKETVKAVEGKFTFVKRPLRKVKGKGVMENSYVVYQKGNGSPMPYSKTVELYNKLVTLYESNERLECRKLISTVDRTTLEPEIEKNISDIENHLR